jgi:hypothetical protein
MVEGILTLIIVVPTFSNSVILDVLGELGLLDNKLSFVSIGQLICNKQDPQYTSSQIKFPPELQITFEDDSTMFDTGMAKANSLDGFNNHETTLTVLYPNKQHETSLGTGNHNNSRLSTMEGTHQPVRIYGTGYV